MRPDFEPIWNPLKQVSFHWRKVFPNLALITVGSGIFVIGMNGILVPQHFLSGGAAGLALIIHYLVPRFDIGITYFILNIPLVLLGWFTISHRFIFYTGFGIGIFSLAAGILRVTFPPLKDPIIAALLAGIICGAGVGITLRSAGSAGGLDILAVFLNKKWGLRPGWVYSASNSVILLGGAFIFDLQMALYTLIYIYTSGKVVDTILTGFNQRKSILIISEHPQAIADRIMTQLHRGVTLFKGKGAYTQREKEVVFSIITLTELPKMKELVYDIDPDAFMVINDTLEVLGKRHGTRRVY